MIEKSNNKTLILTLAAAALLSIGQHAAAHTRLDIATVNEGMRITNNVVIGHTCGAGTYVIGTSVVFPDGVDSTVLVDGQPHAGALTDFVVNWGNNVQMFLNRSVFDLMNEKTNQLGNVVGFWAGGGPGLPDNLYATVPFRLNAVNFESTSCAKSVKFNVSIIDICQITGPDALHTPGVAELWTHNNLGTVYDRDSETDNGPAPLTIHRNLATNPLPESCGEGVNVEVRPSAAQIERDMPIIINGQRIWPQ